MKRVCFVSALCTFADLSLIPNISGMLFFSGTQSVHVRAISYQTKCIQRNISVLIQAMNKTTIAVADILHTNISCSKQNDKMRQLYRAQSEWNTLVCAVSMCPPTKQHPSCSNGIGESIEMRLSKGGLLFFLCQHTKKNRSYYASILFPKKVFHVKIVHLALPINFTTDVLHYTCRCCHIFNSKSVPTCKNRSCFPRN